jgi:hypothetical protein
VWIGGSWLRGGLGRRAHGSGRTEVGEGKLLNWLEEIPTCVAEPGEEDHEEEERQKLSAFLLLSTEVELDVSRERGLAAAEGVMSLGLRGASPAG